MVHRVLKVTPSHYIIRGDNCLDIEYVPHENVIGIVTQWWRNGKSHTINDSWYKTHVTTWLAIHPIVRLTKRIKSICKKIIHKLHK